MRLQLVDGSTGRFRLGGAESAVFYGGFFIQLR